MGSVTYPEHQATPDEYEYLMLRGFYDSLGSRRYFERQHDGGKVTTYVVAVPEGWRAGHTSIRNRETKGGTTYTRGEVFPDVVTAFVDAEIANWWRS